MHQVVFTSKLFLLCVFLLTSSPSPLPSQKPIIGIYTQTDDSSQPTLSLQGNTYIASSYVKFIQLAGAQVIPLFAFASPSVLQSQLSKINGVLFPGGGESINISNRWTSNARLILSYAMRQNDAGRVFPVWGTCLGMQLLAYLTSGYDSRAIAPVRGQIGVINALAFGADSYLFGDMPIDIRNKLSKGQGIVYFNHHYAVTADYYAANQLLKSFWKVVATTTTSFNEVFLSAVEGKEYPFYGVQFHPEKNLFEWKVWADRTDAGAEVTQLLANKFVEKARMNKNSYSTVEEFIKESIYVYNTSYTKMSFSTIYLFHQDIGEIIKDKNNLIREQK